VYTQVAPTAFATIGWKYYLIFIIIPLLGLPVIHMYFPETKGLSLEAVSALFGDPVALDIGNLTPEEKGVMETKFAQLVDTDKLVEIVEFENKNGAKSVELENNEGRN
jgi:hypothetical protein